MSKINFIDLFAGCGGLSEGLLQSNGFNAIAHVEWELPMVETLRHRLINNWGHSVEDAKKRVIFFDIQRTSELLNGNWSEDSINNYGLNNHKESIKHGLKGLIGNSKIDVIVGGPPCQAYSVHGRATDPDSMQNDYRNFLFESFVEIVNEIEPDVFVFENVPGILSAKPGGQSITGRIYEAFKNIGYNILKSEDLSRAIFDAADFGVPQNRKRVLIIGAKKGARCSIESLYNAISKNRNKSAKKTVKDAIGTLPKIFPLEKPIKINGRSVSHLAQDSDVLQHIPRFNNSRDVQIFRTWVENNMNYVSHQEKIDFYKKQTGKDTLYSKYRNLEWDRLSPTIVAHLQKDGLMFIHPDPVQARSITIREAAQLMTFPMDFMFIGSNAMCYKMIGNAVPIEFAKAIAESIYDVINKR